MYHMVIEKKLVLRDWRKPTSTWWHHPWWQWVHVADMADDSSP